MRLDKFLADSALGSRSEIKNTIKKGGVTVNSVTVKDAGFRVDEKDAITYMGQAVAYTPFIYLMMNKPAGVISATEDKTKKTVLSLIDKKYAHYNLFPVGRLDIDTVGLLILSNDGEMAHKALSPKFHVEKTYYVETEKEITEDDKAAFTEGVYIAGGTKTLPAKLSVLSEKSANLSITEGKFHQVKLMFESRGNKVTYLKRIKFGNLKLDDALKEGEYRPLKPDESIF